MILRTCTALLAIALCTTVPLHPPLRAQTGSVPSAASAPGVLSREATAPLVPPAVFFAGRVASTQARNASAVRLADGHLVVATLVDTSGYATDVKERYQAYLITEAALTIDGHALPAGAYGVGFIANDVFTVMDLGGTDLFKAHSLRDAGLKRPMPLEMIVDVDGTGYRLYAGRSFVTLHATAK